MDFSFITDEAFRKSLIADHDEMTRGLESKSWKTVHILAGSIVEALLVEYLVVSKPPSFKGDPLKLVLGDAITACENAGVLKKSTATLCDVIRNYRNLIHPGRIIRLQEEVTPEGASIAANLVTMIVREVAEKRKATYGPTATQLIRKLRTDRHSLTVMPHLLSETNSHEKKALLFSGLIDAYFAEESDFIPEEEIMERLRTAYRQILDSAEDSSKRKAAERFARLVREESTEKIQAFGEAFFSGDDLQSLSAQDLGIVTTYLQNQIESTTETLSDGLVRMTTKLGNYLPSEQLVIKFGNSLVRLVIRLPEGAVGRGINFASNAFDALTDRNKEIFQERIAAWVKISKERKYPAGIAERLSKVEGVWIDIPF